LKTNLGYVTPTQGDVYFSGERMNGKPTKEAVIRGFSMVPVIRRLFQRMTVRDNLQMGA
jgi:branched-chain amino acid transport system ATP-binding protein